MSFDAAAVIEAMRSEIRVLLPERAFLHIDRGDALFISNAPVFSPDLPRFDDFDVVQSETTLRLTPACGYIRRLEGEPGYAPDRLTASLMRFKGEPVDSRTQTVFTDCLKLSCGKHTAEEPDAINTRLRQLSALALRGAISGGGLALCASMLYYLGKQFHKEDIS